jgi:hypothetical protein
MKPSSSFSRILLVSPARVLLAASAAGAAAGLTQAQIMYTIDYRGPTIGVPSPTPITEGDILAPMGGFPGFGPLPPPFVTIHAGAAPAPALGLPLGGACMGHPPGVPCGVQVDALSFGVDYPVTPGPLPAGTFVFGVDEFAVGRPGSPLFPNVLSESPAGDVASDVFAALGLPPAPMPPPPPAAPVPGNRGLIDGNGLPSLSGGVYPGTGLKEPRFPVGGGGPLPGDRMCDFVVNIPPAYMGTYFSLDAGFIDPARGIPNTASGPANGFLPGAILFSPPPAGPIVVYAAPALLGLDLFGPGTDDLDALALWENGVPGYQPPVGPYSWLAGAPTDMVLFSVRRGSAVIGIPDSMFGFPIQPGDILMPPPAPGMPPSIFIPAEWLGLATTRTNGVPFGGDDLTGLDTRNMAIVSNPGFGYCFGDGTGLACPCGNTGIKGHGCGNTAFAAGGLLTGTGVASVSADSVVLHGSALTSATCLYFQGTAVTGVMFGDGLSCAGGPGSIRLGSKHATTTGTSFFPDVGDPKISVKGLIPPGGGTRYYQMWYRDSSPVFCTPSTFNLTNGYAVVWTP